MAVSDLRKSVLEVINAVERKLSITPSTTLTATAFTQVLLQLLNEVIDDLADAGAGEMQWKELYGEVSVTASSSVATYSIDPGALVKTVYEIAFEGQIAPLEQRNVSDINRLGRLNSFGVPRQFALKDVDASANPRFTVWPVPGSSQAGLVFTVAYYFKPNLLTTSDASTIPVFPANLLIQGLYAKALLEESGGAQSDQFNTNFQIYERMKTEALNRYTADTGFQMRIVPRRK